MGEGNIFEAVRLPLDPIQVFPHHEKEKGHG